ncbi:hypothetical protein AKJ09_07905 [Labilithrix luteola]|uniref:Uncharacterized protein n=1 Tax=Labilithrix luteola TaxID=1391654 RepID=A0A0K1Q6H4_9BACT|nr:hypothetical protein [Labilithrix luteola]AKV01242.1 hypothetical protein AKJ09_07905 [Labilithrix luteola]
MKTTFLLLGACTILSTLSFAPDAKAAVTMTLGGGLGSQATGSACGAPHQFEGFSVHSSSPVSLPDGTYRAFMGGSTSWQIKKFNTTDPDIPIQGFVRVDVIEVSVFGAETIRASYVRSLDTSGVYGATATTGALIPDNQEFGTFVAGANSGARYIVRGTAWSDACSRAYVINVRVDLVQQ